MAKRRYKNKAKRAFVGLKRKVNINCDTLNKIEKMDDSDEIIAGEEICKVDPQVKVQVTETVKSDSILTESDSDGLKRVTQPKNKITKSRGRQSDIYKSVGKQMLKSDETGGDEILIFPTEVDGETCIDIQCGSNEACMYLERLCVGSRGACIKFTDNWLTPNEFQMVSGRETAKDWKRSIRHKGRSLKLLINKGLITIQSSSPKKVNVENEKKSKDKDIESNSDNGGNPETFEKSSVATNNVPEPRSHDAPKKRGRKPKKQRGRRPVDRNDDKIAIGVNGKDKTRKETEATVTTSDIKEQAEATVDRNPDTADNSDGNAHADEMPAPADTRTEEERRLDEFVKSLKLTKTTGQTVAIPKPATAVPVNNVVSVMKAPALTNATVQQVDVSRVDDGIHVDGDVDPEMPILQKEADVISGYDNERMDISVSVDALTATVTPPPTPPSERIGMEPKLLQTDEVKHIETFKSTLASPSVGLKLIINREKVKLCDSETDTIVKDESESPVKLEQLTQGDITQKPEEATKALLLHDALQSARKYKEQLQQSRQTSPTKTAPSVTKPVAHVSEKTLHNANTSYKHQPAVKLEHTRFMDGIVKSEYSLGGSPDKRSIGNIPSVAHMPSVEDIRRLSAMSFKDFMSVMTSIYGPLPFPVDQTDATLTSLQDLQQKYDMLRLLLTQGHPVADGHSPQAQSSSLLYPMVTQQLLLAMTQQLYSMCNIPGMPVNANSVPPNHQYKSTKPSRVPSSHNARKAEIHSVRNNVQSPMQTLPAKHTDDYVRNKRSSNETSRNYPLYNGNNANHAQPDNSVRKRKYMEVDSDGALDLSVKKPRQTSEANPIISKPTSVPNIDGPLDFSMKPNHSTYSDVHRRDTTGSHSSFTNGHKNVYRNSVSHGSTTHGLLSATVPSHATYTNGMAVNGRSRCTCNSGYTDIAGWSVEQVCYFLKSLNGCSPYVKTFHEQGISGRLLPYLTTQHLTRTLGMSLGPAMTLIQAVEHKLRDKKSPCLECKSHKVPVAMPIHS